MTAPMRVANFLLDAYTRQRTALFYLPMTRIDIADYIGLTTETVSRVLSRYVELRLIAIPNTKQIELIDIDGLETIIQEGFDPTLGNGYGTRRKRSGTRASTVQPDRALRIRMSTRLTSKESPFRGTKGGSRRLG